ncbi:MAG: HAMP domain-containing histidine kinase, partial [Sphaerospermopsis sp. SIO1G2]|nr:HAMP domain-containing histidine kinase [Sphaerospermopsis sp. SIO1G2]
DSTIMILQNRLKAKQNHPKISVIKNYGYLPTVQCYPGQINQVFMNILSNAIDAVEEIEPVTKPRQITITTNRISDSHLSIKIADNGPGISPDIVPQLFDPFFTTKGIGKGTGLGLSISHQIIVDKHQGKLSCSSDLGEGTEFVIELPIKQITENE